MNWKVFFSCWAIVGCSMAVVAVLLCLTYLVSKLNMTPAVACIFVLVVVTLIVSLSLGVLVK